LRIRSVHISGVLDHQTFLPLFFLSTAGMASGMSLGPELPLVLTAGMAGSWLGSHFQQSMSSSRVLNLTAASAAVAGFFGLPMAGALFVLELPVSRHPFYLFLFSFSHSLDWPNAASNGSSVL
jgi:H+/Cl- antiporter ClcA